MIVSLYLWGGVQSRAPPPVFVMLWVQTLQTWLILCWAVNRTICLWAASQLISAKHHFLEDAEQMFPAAYKSPSQERNGVPARGSTALCLRRKVWWQPCWISGGLSAGGVVLRFHSLWIFIDSAQKPTETFKRGELRSSAAASRRGLLWVKDLDDSRRASGAPSGRLLPHGHVTPPSSESRAH